MTNHQAPDRFRDGGNDGRNNGNAGAKLPPFTGKESWKVWFGRFEDVATMRGWNNDDRLNELLPKLQGIAGEFVYEQLRQEVHLDYPTLVHRLQSRFFKIETPHTLAIQFSHRDQRHNESPEDYAAELKRLYDRAYPHRDMETRREDLLRRFLDGLRDSQAKYQVEFVKDPANIDQAVYEIVHWLEVSHNQGKSGDHPKHKVRCATDTCDSEQCGSESQISDDSHIARARVTPGKCKDKQGALSNNGASDSTPKPADAPVQGTVATPEAPSNPQNDGLTKQV